jgi:hypothetical protein
LIQCRVELRVELRFHRNNIAIHVEQTAAAATAAGCSAIAHGGGGGGGDQRVRNREVCLIISDFRSHFDSGANWLGYTLTSAVFVQKPATLKT